MVRRVDEVMLRARVTEAQRVAYASLGSEGGLLVRGNSWDKMKHE